MRRKEGTLIPLELAVCASAVDLLESGAEEFYGYQLAKRLADICDHRLLTAYGTLYRTLGRLESMGILESYWEDPSVPARENRPGRRHYRLTPAGEVTAREARKTLAEQARKVPRRKLAPA